MQMNDIALLKDLIFHHLIKAFDFLSTKSNVIKNIIRIWNCLVYFFFFNYRSSLFYFTNDQTEKRFRPVKTVYVEILSYALLGYS